MALPFKMQQQGAAAAMASGGSATGNGTTLTNTNIMAQRKSQQLLSANKDGRSK